MITKLPVAWFCAPHREEERWDWGGASVDDAINAGLDLYAWRKGSGFWVAPGHPTTAAEEADGQEEEYTVDAEQAQWIPTDSD